MKKKLSNIVLTGFRATGKSTLGRIIAQKLGYGFLDTDTEICRRFGATVAEIVTEHGWDIFRQAEAKLLSELCLVSGMIIATGGGAIEHLAQWQPLREVSYVVWLDADAGTIHSRVSTDPVSTHQRPRLSLASPSGKDEIDAMLRYRNPLYAAGSDLRLDTVGHTPEELAAGLCEVLELLREKENKA
nr:shikimate kinase [uncultured Desulfobulbus sp.]